VPISSTNARISNAYRKLVIGNIGNGNTITLAKFLYTAETIW